MSEAELALERRTPARTPSLAARLDAAAKRATDVLVASVQLLLTAPAWVLIPVAIKLEDGDPVFYEQERVGRNGGETVRLEEIPGYGARHSVRPGLTGLAQVCAPPGPAPPPEVPLRPPLRAEADAVAGPEAEREKRVNQPPRRVVGGGARGGVTRSSTRATSWDESDRRTRTCR